MRQLLWKEWHEQSWKLAFGCIVVSAFAGIGLRTRIIPDEEMMMWVCFPAMCLLPLLAATGLIPAERNNGTLEALTALPVSLRKVLAVKTITGLILCAVPMLAALAISLAIAGGRELETGLIISIYARSIFTSVALFIWMLALTIRLPSEARAAMVSIGVLMCWSMATAGLREIGLPVLRTVSPFSFAIDNLGLRRGESVSSLGLNLLVEGTIGVGLLFWASRAIAKDVHATAKRRDTMREIRALLWKEWCETRLFLWIGWGLFIGLPIIGGLERIAMYAHRFEFDASQCISLFGPVLALVVGVAATCRDLQPKLEDFWQSRPMGCVRLFVVKYAVALAVVLAAAALPLMIEFFSRLDRSTARQALALSFLWTEIFSIGFASGCLFRKNSYAAAVAVAAMLLICFLPIVFPPLARFNLGGLLDPAAGLPWVWNGIALDVAAGTLAVSLLMALLGLLAVRFDWHIASEQPLIYGAAGVAFVVLLESAAFQLGTNLPEISSVAIPAWPTQFGLRSLHVEKLSGRVVWQNWNLSNSFSWSCAGVPFTVSENKIEVGPKCEIRSVDGAWVGDFSVLRSERDPSISYELKFNSTSIAPGPGTDLVAVLGLRFGSIDSLYQIQLWKGPQGHTAYPLGRVLGERLYVVGDRTMVFSISDPPHPKLLSDQPIRWERRRSVISSEEPTIDLPAFPGMPAMERLKLAIGLYGYDPRYTPFDGTHWCRACLPGDDQSERSAVLEELRLTSLTDNAAQFELAGKRDPKLLDWIVGRRGNYIQSMAIQNGFLYAIQSGCVSVYSLDETKPLLMVAHFAAPMVEACAPLDDGRSIAAGGGKLWLLGPPPRH